MSSPGARFPLVWLLCAAGLALIQGAKPSGLPPIVFVSRMPLAEPGAIPGLGPHHAATSPGGRLLLRSSDGGVRPLVLPESFLDVSDPDVSPSGTWIAFAATVHPDSGWRLWRVRRDGTNLVPITRSDRDLDLASLGVPASYRRYDDLDPCWVNENLLCFASTRLPMRAQYADVPVANLYLVGADGSKLRRITTERNGAAEPHQEPRTGRIVYSRWWFNTWQASVMDRGGISAVPAHALPRDTINLWHLVAIEPDALGPRLAAGPTRPRLQGTTCEAAPLTDGGWIATYASNLGLSPSPGATGLHRLKLDGGPSQRMIGALVSETGTDPYQGTIGLAAPSACSPASLGDGRILFGWSPGARGDFGLWIGKVDGSGLEAVVDLPGTLELDPAPLLARRLVDPGWGRVAGFAPEADRILLGGRIDDLGLGRFSFECDDVFESGGLPGAPEPAHGLVLRFFASVPKFGSASGDTAFLVREEPVAHNGAVFARGLPAGVPMFEQLMDSNGAPLQTTHGPAHVPGLNAGAPGQTTRCVGCHSGHSRLPVTRSKKP